MTEALENAYKYWSQTCFEPFNVQDRDKLRLSHSWFWRNILNILFPVSVCFLSFFQLSLEILRVFCELFNLNSLIQCKILFFFFLPIEWSMKNRKGFSFQTFSWSNFSCILHISILVLMLLSRDKYLFVLIFRNINIYGQSSGWLAPCII